MLDMLDLYRRHAKKCANRALGIKHTNCRCPIWCYGSVPKPGGGEKVVRLTLQTRDWARAVRRAHNPAHDA